MEHIKGKNKGKLMLYALSTCVWCGKTKKLLNDLGVEYTYEDVDLLTPDEYDKISSVFKKWNASGFPLLVIDDRMCVRGYSEREIKEALKL